ncbi:unnamed protein product [Callosobruchus maculatus]|uniref:RNase H type-1 domain-containing protein n=1 Tax=Callosobruchus maculatus TaxID=64391 RepID=A0A653CNS6_CALMS|nr:unnamed protein product [Callosobruchus maculatus]
MGEARMGYSRLQTLPRGMYKDLGYNLLLFFFGCHLLSSKVADHNQIAEYVGHTIMDARKDHITPKYIFNKKFETIIRDRELCEVNNLHREIVWYTDGSKTEQGTGAGIFGRGTRQSIPLGKYGSVFQSEATLRALEAPKVTSALVWECLQEVGRLAEHNKVTLEWVPGHSGIRGNERADELARLGSSALFIGAEPALGVPKSTIRHQVAPCKKTAETLLFLSRNQLRITTGLLTGHCGLKEHLNKMGLYNGDLNCRLCGRGTASALQVLCEYEALDHKRQQLFGKTKLEPMEYSSAPGPGTYRILTKDPTKTIVRKTKKLVKNSSLDEETKEKDKTNLFRHVLTTTYFVWDTNMYEKIEGVAMGSPLSPVVANLVMEKIEQAALKSAQYKPKIWLRYVDDTFVVWNHGRENLEEFLEHLNSVHEDIHEKYGIIRTLSERARKVCEPEELDTELEHLKNASKTNGYTEKEITRTMRRNKAKGFLPYVPGITDRIGKMSITYYDTTAYRCPNFITIHPAVTEITWLEKRVQTDRPTDRRK